MSSTPVARGGYLTGQHAVEAALDAVIIIDSAGLVVEWNPAACEVFGYARGEAVGRLLADLIIPEELREAHQQGLERHLETGEISVLNRRLKIPGVRSDGERLLIELTISPLGPVEERLFIGWMRDVTELEAAKDALEQSERRLSAMLANLSDIVTVIDADGSWVSSSGVGLRTLGYGEDLGSHGGLLELLHPDDRNHIRRLTADPAPRTGWVDQRHDLRVCASDGVYRVLDTVVEDLRLDPAINAFVLSSRDATAERKAESRHREVMSRLEALVDSLSDGVLFVDEDHNVSFANQEFCDLFGVVLPPAQLIGRSTSELRDSAIGAVSDKSSFLAHIGERYDANTRVFGEEISMSSGRVLERDYIPVTVADAHSGFLWVYRDVTERKQLDDHREQVIVTETMAREQAEEQNRSLREIAEFKSDLVAMVSHELRTPLTSILSFAELLRSDLTRPESAEQQDFIEIVDRNAKRLLHLVDDLLLLGQLESGAIAVGETTFPVDHLLDEAAAELAARATEKNLSMVVTAEEGPAVFGDRSRLLQVVDNLLSNAIKFSSHGSTVNVRARRDPTSWVVSVADEGSGFPSEARDQLFDKFYRSPDAAKQVPGTGLGLAICKAIVELHGGEIWADNTSPHGATFEFSIPDRGVVR